MADACKAELQAKYERQKANINGGKVDAILAEYTDDLIYGPPNNNGLFGKQAMREFVTQFIAGGNSVSDVVLEEVDLAGDNTAIARGLAVHNVGGKPEKVKWIHVHKKVGGKWLLQREIWNHRA